MAGELSHFEIPAADVERAKTFWSGLLGWSFDRWDGSKEYWQTAASGGAAGGLFPTRDLEHNALIVSFRVDDLDASLARAHELGGSCDERRGIPGIGWYTRCRDTEGNLFALFQPDESAST